MDTINSIDKSSSMEIEKVNQIGHSIFEDPELKKYLNDAERLTARTNNDTIKKHSLALNADNDRSKAGINEKFVKIINGLKRDIMILQDKEKKMRQKYEKILKTCVETKNERDMFKQSYFDKEQ